MKKDKKKKKKKDVWDEDWKVDEGSDFPVHEKYTQEEPFKEI